MLKKVFSVVLLVTLLLSLVTVANAETKSATAVSYVVVSAVDGDVAITPPGSKTGVLIAGTNDDKLTVTGNYSKLVSKDIKIAVVLNGLLDATKDKLDYTKDQVIINNDGYNLTEKDMFTVTTDGARTVIWLTLTLNDYSLNNVNPNDVGSIAYYAVTVVKDGNVRFDYDFSVAYVDGDYTTSNLMGDVNNDILKMVSAYNFVPTVPATEIPVDGELYVVNASKLNVRATASAKADVVASLTQNDSVTVLAVEGNWAKVLLKDNTTAYVFAKYIAAVAK